jgi:hypothetical protein
MVNFIPVPDHVILSKIHKNNSRGWEELYDNHASPMLTIIYQLTRNREKGEEILIDIFTSSRFRSYVLSVTSRLRFHLCTFVFNYTLKQMQEEGAEPDEEMIARLPKVLQFLYNKNKASNETLLHEKSTGPAYKSVHTYKWLPVFGANLYA